MPLQEVMESTTERQLVVWMAWLAIQLNQPSRSDYYSMVIAAEIRRGNSKNPRSVKVGDFKLRFNSDSRSSSVPDETKLKLMKARWLAITNIGAGPRPSHPREYVKPSPNRHPVPASSSSQEK